MFVLGAVPIIPEFDWNVAQPDVIRPKHQTRPGLFSLIREPIEIIVDFDWFVQETDVVLPLPVEPGLFALIREPIEIIVDFDWFVQAPVAPIKPTRPEGLYVLPEFAEEPVPEFDWFVAPADVIRAPHQVRPGLYALIREPIEIIVDFDWWVPSADVVQPLPRPEGVSVKGYDNTEIFQDFGWFVLPADVVQPLPRPEGMFILGEVPIVAPVPDWMHPAQPDVMRPLHQVRSGMFVIPELAQPVFTTPLEYFIQICLILWEMEQNGLLPDASSFVKILITFTASGYEASEDTKNTLDSLIKEDLPPPSGYVS